MEHIKQPKVDDVRMLDRYNFKKPLIGTLYITATHTIFVEPETNKETWILHTHVESIDKLPLTTTGSPLLIRCKTFLSVTFVIPKERECHNCYQSLLKLSQPDDVQSLYCFQYTSNESLNKSYGWDFFNIKSEFSRMQVPNKEWSLCTLNTNYEICETYPSQVYVPTNVNSATLIGSSRFRSKGRLPVLTYLHHNKASICRCSQPLSGFNARCLEDEQLFEAIRKTNPDSEFMYVVDTRPKINAMANRAAGKGYENEAFYENMKFQFLGIENIHVMRSSLQKMIDTCEQKTLTMSGFLNNLEASGWLKHIRAILDTSNFISSAVEKGISVVVHCSDGWDRTAQVCSIASFLLNPYYRTIVGYQMLIEKDWLAFGHKFSDRCGYLKGDGKEISPVFTQFLDCTFQMMQQHADAFEFNERFLLTIHDHVQSCQYGTFIGNCEKDRLRLRVAETTYSLWSYVANHLNEFINPLYGPGMADTIAPNLAPQSIIFWRGMYGRFESGVHPREPLEDLLLASRDHCNSLEDHVNHLTKRIAGFKNMLTSSVRDTISSMSGRSNGTTLDAVDGRDKNKSTNGEQPIKLSLSNLSLMDNSIAQVSAEINSVAIDWKPFRNSTTCSCSIPFDQITRKNHCRRCGEVFCARCIDRTAVLPGHDSQVPVPVCRACLAVIQ